VPVEDATRFATVFGDDVTLAVDPATNEPEMTYLGPAVRAFFNNGGQRCWVVRVAGAGARTNVFPVPGLLQIQLSDGSASPAFAAARSGGSWSDGLQVAATPFVQPLTAVSLLPNPAGIAAELDVRTPVDVGDLVQMTAGGYTVMFTVMSATLGPAAVSSPPGPPVLLAVGDKVAWFLNSPPPALSLAGAQARTFTQELAPSTLASPNPPVPTNPAPPIVPDPAPAAVMVLGVSFDDTTGITTLLLDPSASLPSLGAFVRVDAGGEQLWLTVATAQVVSYEGSPPGSALQVTGQGLWLLANAPDLLPALGGDDIAQTLTFQLWVIQDDGSPTLLPATLGFDERSASFWGALPSDAQTYDPTVPGGLSIVPAAHADLWQASSAINFQLAGNAPAATLFVPVAMPALPKAPLPSVVPVADAAHRAGLDQFGPALFLDPDANLVGADVTSLPAIANFIRYQSPAPRPLQGLYAVMDVNEATIVAVPDAVHRPWVPTAGVTVPAPKASASLQDPALWHARPCNAADLPGNLTAPPWRFFLNCDARVIPAPVLATPANPDDLGTFSLTWSAADAGPFYLQEATLPDFSDAVLLQSVDNNSLTIYGRGEGTYYYRVRVQVGELTSDWSNGVAVLVSPNPSYALDPTVPQAPLLLDVHRALLRMCAARGDLLAVLAAPADFVVEDALNYVNELTGLAPKPAGPAGVLPLGFGEAVALNYGAFYYPWLICPQGPGSDVVQTVPPDGAAAGIMAKRAIARGAWIAPANEPAAGVVDLTPPVPSMAWLNLQNAAINLFRREPHGFVVLDADTLSNDPNTFPVNVRRLLMLIRRLALKKAGHYVFESNDDALRRSVQRGFGRVLDELFVQGAFAGATAATSYQVSTPIASGDLENGRFIVELRIAPSWPLRFLTVRLVQGGDGSLTVQEQ
jgi:hypothetical protein